MYDHPFYFSIYPPISASPYYTVNQHPFRTYPQVNVKKFSASVKTFQQLMDQARILLKRLEDPSFSRKVMTAAQQGKQREVDQLIKSIRLRVPVITKYTPSDIIFQLISPLQNLEHPENCCTLTLALKWGR